MPTTFFQVIYLYLDTPPVSSTKRFFFHWAIVNISQTVNFCHQWLGHIPAIHKHLGERDQFAVDQII